jgi:hypothetical protein
MIATESPVKRVEDGRADFVGVVIGGRVVSARRRREAR